MTCVEMIQQSKCSTYTLYLCGGECTEKCEYYGVARDDCHAGTVNLMPEKCLHDGDNSTRTPATNQTNLRATTCCIMWVTTNMVLGVPKCLSKST
jgi:hypothetical protein